MKRTERLTCWLPLLPLAFLAVMQLAPLWRLWQEGNGQFDPALLADGYLRWRIGWTLLQALLSCLLTALIGVPLAWVLARYEFCGRRLLLRLLLLPFVMPTLVAGLGVLALFGPHGLTPWNGQDTPWLLLYGNLFYNLPLVIRTTTDGFTAVPASQLAAARTLGASAWRTFWRVEWPQARPWLAAALCLVFLYCFSGFGLALVLGGQRYATIEVEIYTLVAYELNLADASILALLALAISAVATLAYVWLTRRLATAARVEPVARRRVRTIGQRLVLTLALLTLALCCAAPLCAVLMKALTAADIAAVLLNDDTLAALWNTLRFSGMALLLATLLGLSHALAARRWLLLRAAAFLPFMISPVCVAFGLLLCYPDWTASLGLLVACYALFAYPFIAKSLFAALDSLPVNLLPAARSLGATRARAFVRVAWPLLSAAFRRGLAFAAATAVGEFAVTLFLARPEWQTLTTLIYHYLGRPGAANLDAALVLSAVLMALALLAFVAIEWRGGEERLHA